MRFVKVMMFVFRLVFGLIYMMSGFLKLVDPVGTGLIVEEYLNALHIGFLRFGALPFGIALACLEFLTGLAVMLSIRIREAAYAGLFLSSFFTVLTLVLALTDSITFCGCFGEAVSLTMWQTFLKNVILTICIIPVFIHRNSFRKVAPAIAEWGYLVAHLALMLSLSLLSLLHLPYVEFGDFKVGTNLAVKLEEMNSASRFETRFIYEKEGTRQYFSLDELPDSTWTFIDSENFSEGDDQLQMFDMSISDIDGRLISEEIVECEFPEFLFVVTRPEKLEEDYWEKVSAAVDSVVSHGGIAYVTVPSMDRRMKEVAKRFPLIGKSLAFADFKTLISIVRSNGGMVYVEDGIVVKKWSRSEFSPEDTVTAILTDTDEMVAQESISQRVFYEVTLLLIFVILILFRYICSILYGKKKPEEPVKEDK